MSVFTVVIIIWGIYQLGVSLMKKGKQQTPGRVSGPHNLPDVRSIRETLLKNPKGSWRDRMLQMQQALENSSRQVEERTINLESLQSAKPKDVIDDYIQPQGIQIQEGSGVTQGAKGTIFNEEPQGIGVYRGQEENLGNSMSRGTQAVSGPCLSMANRELVQGVIWAEILGKPRALQPFRGPRS